MPEISRTKSWTKIHYNANGYRRAIDKTPNNRLQRRIGTAIKKLQTAEKKLIKAAKAIDEFGPDVPLVSHESYALYVAETSKEEILDELNQIKLRIDKAIAHAEKEKKKEKQLGLSDRGLPADPLPKALESHAARIFEQITGNRAVRRIDRQTHKPAGHYFMFLSDLFLALDIKANPDKTMKVAHKRKKSDIGAM